MYRSYPDYYNQNFIQTESLRIDIPLLFPEEKYVLYADCDVIFLKDIPHIEFEQPLAVAIRKYYINDTKFFNNGIMILNIPEMKKCYNDFKKFFIDSNYSFKIGDTTTQGAYNSYFQNKVFELPLEFNWHAFWYTNPNAHILHMCGPKPAQYQELYKNPQKFEKMYRQCILRKDSVISLLKYWNEYAEREDQVTI
jgi:lipopolysaccharide biosynthesis glycosyltransferase